MLGEANLKQHKDELIEIRRHLHKFPELANEEFLTSSYIENYLKDCGLEVTNGIAGTGLIAVLEGSDGPTIGIRTEMDALPINEEHEVDYRSTRDNVMHACGHDGHMAVALITAKILSGMKNRLKGKVVFIFQPAEENLPAGGAKRMVEDAEAVLDNVNAIFGFHFWPTLPVGTIAVSKSAMMAAGDVFEIKFRGIGAHGANPHQSSDVLMMTSDAILSLTSIISRNIKPGTLATLSVGIVKGGESPNVLPSLSLTKGTTRYIDESFRDIFPEKIRRVLDGVCNSYNGSYELNYQYGYPLLKNDPDMADLVKKCALTAQNVTSIDTVTQPALTSEDFAVFLEKIPGCYFWIGSQTNDSEVINLLHSPKFDLDEMAMLTAVEMYLLICNELLQS